MLLKSRTNKSKIYQNFMYVTLFFQKVVNFFLQKMLYFAIIIIDFILVYILDYNKTFGWKNETNLPSQQ